MAIKYDPNVFSDMDSYRHIVGFLLKSYNNRIKYQGRFDATDFLAEEMRIVVLDFLVNPEYGCKKKDLNNEMLLSSLQEVDFFKTFDASSLINQCIAVVSDSDSIETYYEKVKKLAFLRKLTDMGFDVDEYIDITGTDGDMKRKGERAERLKKTTLDELVAAFRDKYETMQRKFMDTVDVATESDASAGIMDLVFQLAEKPEVGVRMPGKIFSAATRGARFGKLYLRSASSSTGKSRLAVFDACDIAFPERWYERADGDEGFDGPGFYIEQNKEKSDRESRRVLFITTETTCNEVRPTILAKLSGINEGKIITGRTLKEADDNIEKKRLFHAIAIMEKYKNNFYLEQIENPDMTNVEAMIRKYVNQKDVKYVFFDYIFSSSNLVTEVNNSKLREDTLLGLMANKLKELATELNIFIMTSTQVNADGMQKGGFKDEKCLRGAKSLADKVDVGMILSKVEDKDEKIFESYYSEMEYQKEPDSRCLVLDIYKNRSAQYNHVRIPIRINLGTGERADAAILTEGGDPYPLTDDFDFIREIQGITLRKNTEWEKERMSIENG